MVIKQVTIYSDGSCGPSNPGNMGLGILYVNQMGVELKSFSVHAGPGTNNRAELLAAIVALRGIQDKNVEVILYTDSNYVVQGMRSWVYKWIKERRLGMGPNPVKNIDLWRILYHLTKEFKTKVKFNWVKGHNGQQGNEEVDKLAKKGYMITDPEVIARHARIFDEEFTKLASKEIYSIHVNDQLRLHFPPKEK